MFQTIPYIMFVKHTIREDTHVSHSLHLVLLFLLPEQGPDAPSGEADKGPPHGWNVACLQQDVAFWLPLEICPSTALDGIQHTSDVRYHGIEVDQTWNAAGSSHAYGILPACCQHMIAHDIDRFILKEMPLHLFWTNPDCMKPAHLLQSILTICFLCKPQQQCPYPDFGLSLQKLNDVEKLPWNSAWQTTFRSSHV